MGLGDWMWVGVPPESNSSSDGNRSAILCCDGAVFNGDVEGYRKLGCPRTVACLHVNTVRLFEAAASASAAPFKLSSSVLAGDNLALVSLVQQCSGKCSNKS